MKVSLVLFTLDEIDGMRAVVPRLDPAWYDELWVIDGGSTDGTVEWARARGLSVARQRLPGLGGAFQEALARVTGDVAVFFSPDGNSVPERLPDLAAAMREGHDVVIVSRYRDGARSEDDDRVTALGNRAFTALVNALYGAHLTDVLVMYRAYRVDLLREVRVDTLGNAWGSQVLCRALRRGKRVAEIPGDEPARIGGARKMRPLAFGSRELYTILRERARRRL
jgi:glycosyltransferase involved in cell wall biosynthesis